MELYVLVSFWLGVLAFIIRIITLAVEDWPKQQKPKSLGMQVAETLLGIGVTVWAGCALWY